MDIFANINHLNDAISHATAPAFMLGAVASYMAILISRLERVADKRRALRTNPASDPTGEIEASFARRMELLSRAISFAVVSALFTAGLLIGGFLAALLGVGHGTVMAGMFAIALALLMASLVNLAREMKIYMVYMHLE